jgi:hypothetical protein
MSKPAVHRVNAQVKAPTDGDSGQITTGYYIIKDGVLLMTNPDGVQMLRDDGKPFSHKLREGENPAPIAASLTKEIRRYLRGESKSQEKFGQPLNYPKTGWL